MEKDASEGSWLEVMVSTTAKDLEVVADVVNQWGSGGVVIEDPAVLCQLAQEKGVEEIAFSPPDQDSLNPVVKGYCPVDDTLAQRLEELQGLLKASGLQAKPRLSWQVLQEADWANAWKAYYHVMEVGKRLLIKPTWEEAPGGERLILDMDPGMAFGSGSHASTTMCLTLLEQYVHPGYRVYDVGTGSGILAIAAAKLGASQVLAVDNDPVAVAAARENVERNQVSHVVQIVEGDLLNTVKDPAELIVANIVADVIMALAPAVAALLKPGGVFLASGIYQGREDEVQRRLEAYHLPVVQSCQQGEWTAFAVVKQHG